MKLSGRNIVLTGASRGLGSTLAVEFAREGAAIAVCARTQAGLRVLQTRLPGLGASAVAVLADVSVADDVERFVKYVVDRWKRIDVLVNNAGVAPARLPVCETHPDDWARTIAVNLTGPYLMTRAVVPYMLPGSAIINVSSRLGRGLMDKGRGVYAASKYGLEGLTRFLAEELLDRGIAVNAVAPGLIATELSQWEGAPTESVVDVFVHLASNRAAGISGKALYAPTWKSELGLI